MYNVKKVNEDLKYSRYFYTELKRDGIMLYNSGNNKLARRKPLNFGEIKKQGEEYFRYAEHILKQLSSDDYLAQEGENHGFVLLHSVGSFPHDSEIDTPLNYADYYYLEALKRYKDLKEKSENPSY